MPFIAQVYRIFIASPSDVAEERNAVREIVEEWNVVNAATRGTVLLPVGWDTHAVPEMGIRPQEHINETVLRDCDVLVGMFWSRMGSDAGQGKTGTEEEIEKHLSTGKPARIYFAEKPLPATVDTEQLNAVRALRSRIEKNRTGLFGCYSDLQGFRDSFRKHLGIVMNGIASVAMAPAPAEPEPITLHYAGAILLKGMAASKEAMLFVKHGLIAVPGGPGWETSGNGRLRADLEEAIQQLFELGYIRDRDGLRERFTLTKAGFDVAGQLPDPGQ